MNTPNVTAYLEARLALFYLLQRAYAAPLSPDLAADLQEAAALCDPDLPPVAPLNPVADELEFNRLFVGPGRLPAPPYESVWRSEDRLLVQAAAGTVRSLYRQHGLKGRADRSEPEDHLATELEFYAWLQQGALRAAEAGHMTECRRLTEAQQGFLQAHLSGWVPAFCQAVSDQTTSPFYRSLADLTRSVLAHEARVLSTLMTVIPAKEEPAHA